ncbi:MAG: two-component system response regulator, partial [Pseudomonadota bacterium]
MDSTGTAPEAPEATERTPAGALSVAREAARHAQAAAPAPSAAPSVEAGASAVGDDDGGGTSPTDLTVMMIDDEPMLTEVIGAYLEDAGYRRLVAVNDATTALRELRQRDPALVLLDLVMPGMSGFEILQAMRRDERL